MIESRALPSDTNLLALHRLAPSRYPLLLESVASSTAQGRWDLLLATDGTGLRLEADGRTSTLDGQSVAADFLTALDAQWQGLRVPREEPRWPFRGGWALQLNYELAAQVERVLTLPRTPAGNPVALALRCPAAVLRDRLSGQCVALAETGSTALLTTISEDLAASCLQPGLGAWQEPAEIHEEDPQRFLAGVERILEYLAAGDIFQVNLSRTWRARFKRAVDPAAFYARLRIANPAPFAGLFVAGDWAVASSSPERLVSIRGEVVETRPIAGTRPRFEGDDDAARMRELVGHPKERAEHVMLIDLERNDLGRVCQAGSVEVDELMSVESYAHVHHIVSNVRGRLRAGTTPGDVIRATFPGGTITGCPKVRCMQIIAELEGQARGAYTGAFGWLNRDGDMDLNILIRSAEIANTADGPAHVIFRTGAGIVADSIPDRELDETRAKARGMLKALSG